MIDPHGSLESYFRSVEAWNKPKAGTEDTEEMVKAIAVREQVSEVLKPDKKVVPLHVEELHPEKE